MPQTSVFRWLNGRGWLVLSGLTDPLAGDIGGVRSLALARSSADGGVACVSLSGDANRAELLLADLTDLGAPSGYLVDVFAEDDATIRRQLADAGVIVIDSAVDAKTAQSALMGAPMNGIQEAYTNGAMVLIEGHTIAAFGTWVVGVDGGIGSGAEWLEGAAVMPAYLANTNGRDVVVHEPEAVLVGINQGSALALGPDGEVEIWGIGEVGVVLGANYTAE
jgi:hypothetical protein